VLVTARASGTEYEISLTNPGQKPTTIGNKQFYGGIVYDNSDRLFAVTSSAIVELDPKTFQVIASSGPLSGLDGLSFDPFSGDLFASTHVVSPVSGRQGIYEVSLQPGNFLHATLITSSLLPTTFNPDGIEPDGEGNVYVASFLGAIYQYNITSGKLTALTSPLRGLDDLVPLQGTGGHSVPHYWFFEEAANKFGAIDPTTGQITETPPLTHANTQVEGITAGLGGTLWFTEFNTNQIGMIDTDTDKITEFPLPTPGAQPFGIVRGPDGNLWFTEAGANQVGRINPTTGIIQEFPIDSSGSDQAESITVGPDSNLWFTLTGTNKIGAMNPTTGKMVGEYSVPTANAGLAQIVSDPADGNLWFTEAGADQVGRIDPATGAIAEFAVPTAGAAPTAIAAEKDGNLWFIESSTSKIAELSPNNPNHITEYVVPGLTPVAPTVLREETVTAPKTNKRGKKVGKPVLAGFELDYSAAMNPATAGLAANYQVTVTITKRIKRKHVTVRAPVAVRASYDASRNAVTLTLVGKQLFAQGGQITVIAAPPSGVSSASGDLLAANDTVFTILPKAEGIWPA
jgi:virginiamycin B lyase